MDHFSNQENDMKPETTKQHILAWDIGDRIGRKSRNVQRTRRELKTTLRRMRRRVYRMCEATGN